MTQLLEQVYTQTKQLPDREQDAIASLILRELADEERRSARFASFQDASFSYISNDGIRAQIIGSPFYVLSLLEVRDRLNANPDAPDPTPDNLASGMNISLAQVYAALAYYHANKKLFDAELERKRQAREKFWEEQIARVGGANVWAELYGALPDDDSDEEVIAALEIIS